MNMKCEEDLGNNKVVVKVSWTKRKWASDPKLLIKWQHVEAYIKENYYDNKDIKIIDIIRFNTRSKNCTSRGKEKERKA